MPGKEIRDAFQTSNPLKSEVWNLRATVSLVKFHFFSPEFRCHHLQAYAWAEKGGTLMKPTLLLCNNPVVIVNSLSLSFDRPLSAILKRCDLFSLHWALRKDMALDNGN